MCLLEPLKNTLSLREKPALIRFRIHWPSWIRHWTVLPYTCFLTLVPTCFGSCMVYFFYAALEKVSAVLRIRIRDRVLFDPWIRDRFFPDPGSRIPDPGSQDHIFKSFLTIFFCKNFYNSLKIGPNFFLQHFKAKIIYNYVKFVAT